MKKKRLLYGAIILLCLVGICFRLDKYLIQQYQILTFSQDVKNNKFRKGEASVIPLRYFHKIPPSIIKSYLSQTEDALLLSWIIASHNEEHLLLLEDLSKTENKELSTLCKIGEIWLRQFSTLSLENKDVFIQESVIFKSFVNKVKQLIKDNNLIENENIAYAIIAAQMGWNDIDEYKKQQNDYFLKRAIVLFNISLDFCSSDNYDAYWGYAIIMELRAQISSDTNNTEKLLISSLDFFQIASRKEIPVAEKSFFYMDWANVYNEIGKLYSQNSDADKSLSALNKGKSLLLCVLKGEPENGRAYFLLSINSYYRNDINKAREYADRAMENKFTLPSEYIYALKMAGKNE